MVDPHPPPFFFFFFFFLFVVVVVVYLFVIVLFSALEQTRIALCTVPTQPCTMSRHFNESHIHRMHACLAITCHLHFWQNDRDLIRATAVTRGWNGYRNKESTQKPTMEKKVLPPLLSGFEPEIFRS